MRRWGFHCATDGCLLPHPEFCPEANVPGYNRSDRSFTAKRADRRGAKDEWGFSMDEDVSHLCHDGNCVNPGPIVIERSCLNKTRNYCGLLGALADFGEFECECGAQPKCMFR